MEPIRLPSGLGTAIPPRFTTERERVLRILSRWEETVRSAQGILESGTAVSR